MTKTLVVLLDCAEPNLIEKWTSDDSLPNLKKLRLQGSYGRVSSEGEWLANIPWFVLYTGESLEKCDAPYYLLWRPEKMAFDRVSTEAIGLVPFWRRFNAGDPRAIILDMPFVSEPIEFNGVEVAGRISQDTPLAKIETFPKSLKKEIFQRFGHVKRLKEKPSTMSARKFFTIRDEFIKMSSQITDLACWLAKREDWDFMMMDYSPTHIGGHKLWNLDNVVGTTQDLKEGMDDALRQVYIACDREIGRLIQQVGENMNILVLSVHGMRVNATRNDILPEMLRRILQNDQHALPPSSKQNALNTVRNLIPLTFREFVKSRLPIRLQDWLTAFWRVKQTAWDRTPAFCFPGDQYGLIRINLKGRESRGIVDPEKEYRDLCNKIMDGLSSFADGDTKESFIKKVFHRKDILQGTRSMFYPDLVVEWADWPASNHRAVSSPRYGTIKWPLPGHNPDGRSGNHRYEGILLASGPDLKSGTINEAHILDLAPTILTLLGQPVPAEMQGKVLPIIKK